MKERGLTFFKYTDIAPALRKLEWEKLPIEKKRCIVCGIMLTKENIGAFVPGSVRATCNHFGCIMAALIREKKPILAR